MCHTEKIVSKSVTMIKNTLTILLLVISTCSYAVDKVTVVGLFKDKAILTIDGKQRLLATGKTSPEGVNPRRAGLVRRRGGAAQPCPPRLPRPC